MASLLSDDRPWIDPTTLHLLVRLIVGPVFVSEGIQKFLFAADLGTGRFARIGLPMPDVLATIVGTSEIVCGLLIVIGLWTRRAALPLIAIMLVAIVSTKVPILLTKGFWAMAHEARTDWSMLLGSIFLLLGGPGPFSLSSRWGKGSTP